MSATDPLPPIVEIKRKLFGGERRFACGRVAADERRAVVLWRSTEAMHVHGVDLPAGTVSLGHFWTDRFYNAYHWLDGERRTLGFYFNISDRTRIDRDTVEWRDLIVDVLATPAGRLDVVDEDELPASLDDEVAAHIAAGKAAILGDPRGVIDELEAASRALFAVAFPR